MHNSSQRFLFVLALSFLAPIGSQVQGASPQQINDAIEKGKEWLYSQADKEGNWESGDARGRGPRQRTRWGGHTAIAVYALLAAGEKPNNPQLRRAIEFLEKANDVDGTYALALRAQVWWYLGASKETNEPIRRDTSLLLAGCYESGPLAGMYTYGPFSVGGDPSRARMALRPAGGGRPDPDSRLIDPKTGAPPGPNSAPPLVLNGRGRLFPASGSSGRPFFQNTSFASCRRIT